MTSDIDLDIIGKCRFRASVSCCKPEPVNRVTINCEVVWTDRLWGEWFSDECPSGQFMTSCSAPNAWASVNSAYMDNNTCVGHNRFPGTPGSAAGYSHLVCASDVMFVNIVFLTYSDF